MLAVAGDANVANVANVAHVANVAIVANVANAANAANAATVSTAANVANVAIVANVVNVVRGRRRRGKPALPENKNASIHPNSCVPPTPQALRAVPSEVPSSRCATSRRKCQPFKQAAALTRAGTHVLNVVDRKRAHVIRQRSFGCAVDTWRGSDTVADAGCCVPKRIPTTMSHDS